jgi:CRP-like cAMP-binding protein
MFSVPADDSLFADAAERELHAVRSDEGTLRLARRRLRDRYPRADLHRQRSVLLGGARTDVWFAYRDGRSGPVMPNDRWWEKAGCAGFTLHDSGRSTHPNAAFRSLLGLPGANSADVQAGNHLSGDLVARLADSSGPWAERGEVTSTTTLRNPDRDGVDVELHATWNGAGPGRHQVTLRSFAERDEQSDRNAVDAGPLRSLPKRVRQGLIEGADRREMAPGQRLPESLVGDRWAVLVVAGVVRVYLGTDRLEATVRYAGPGSLPGTLWGLGDESLAVGLQSVTPSIVLVLDPDRLHELVTLRASFARSMSDEVRFVLREVARSYALRSSTNLGHRLAREILLLADMMPDETVLPVTEQHLADGVGSIRESIGRTIADFRRRGWLVTTNHGIIILDRAALEAQAAIDPA